MAIVGAMLRKLGWARATSNAEARAVVSAQPLVEISLDADEPPVEVAAPVEASPVEGRPAAPRARRAMHVDDGRVDPLVDGTGDFSLAFASPDAAVVGWVAPRTVLGVAAPPRARRNAHGTGATSTVRAASAHGRFDLGDVTGASPAAPPRVQGRPESWCEVLIRAAEDPITAVDAEPFAEVDPPHSRTTEVGDVFTGEV